MTLTNNLSEDVSVSLTGTDEQLNGRPTKSGSSHPVGKAHEGTKVTWIAISSTQHCHGELQVSSSSKTISIGGNNCQVNAGPVHHGKVTTWRVSVTNDGPDKIEVHITDLLDDKRTDLDFKAVPLNPGASGSVELVPVNGEAHAGVEVKDDNRFCGDKRLIVIKPGNSIHVTEQGQRVIRDCKITEQ